MIPMKDREYKGEHPKFRGARFGPVRGSLTHAQTQFLKPTTPNPKTLAPNQAPLNPNLNPETLNPQTPKPLNP